MKQTLVFTICIIITMQLFSANIDIDKKGFKGGVNFSRLSYDGHKTDPQTKFMFGSYSTYRTKSILAFQSESFVSWKGAETGLETYDFINLDINLLSRFEIDLDKDISTYFLLGPYMGFNVYNSVTSGFVREPWLIDFGGVIAIGVKFDKYSLEFRQSPGYTSVYKQGPTLRHRVTSLLFGMDIKKKSFF